MCTKCNTKDYTCLGCNSKVKYDDYKSEYTAIDCNCCDHNFVCINCWDKNSNYHYWKLRFGHDHAIVNHITGESRLNNFLMSYISLNYPDHMNPELKDQMDKSEKRRNYTSLDEFVKEEGIETVLEWLSRSPTQVGGFYRHTKMKTVNYVVKQSHY